MKRLKNQQKCIIKSRLKNNSPGQIINIKTGYLNYLLKKNKIISVEFKGNSESIKVKKIMHIIQEKISKIKQIQNLKITAKTNKYKTLYQPVNIKRVLQCIEEKHNIKGLEDFTLKLDLNNKFIKEIRSPGMYSLIVKYNNENINRIPLVIENENK